VENHGRSRLFLLFGRLLHHNVSLVLISNAQDEDLPSDKRQGVRTEVVDKLSGLGGQLLKCSQNVHFYPLGTFDTPHGLLDAPVDLKSPYRSL
jgi:hypothetical protein